MKQSGPVPPEVDIDKMEIGDRIKLARIHRLKLEQSGLAERIGVSTMSVSKWERNLHDPGSKHLEKLSEATGMSEEWFRNGRETSPRGRKLLLLLSLLNDDERDDLYHTLETIVDFQFRMTKGSRVRNKE